MTMASSDTPFVRPIIFVILIVTTTAASALDRISARDHYLVDQHGRVRLFHGANSVEKGFPWYDHQALNDTRLSLYKSWGFNVIRLGTMWSGVEPQEGAFNETYIAVLKTIIDKFAKYGIYALLDVHQDGMSSKVGSYDGVPQWVFNKLPKAKHAYPWPFKGNKTASWWETYLTEATSYAFQSFYDNEQQSLDSFANFWRKIASTFKDATSVIGYELLNEPWAGDIYADPLILLPGLAGKYNLKPMYDRLNAAIRQVDNETLIFFEPTTIGIVFESPDFGTGFDSPPGGDAYRNRSVLAWHYYCWVLGNSPMDPYSGWKRDVCDVGLGPKVFDTIETNSFKMKIPTFLTEFGLCVPNNSSTSKDTVECEFVMRRADSYFQSWTYWDSQFFLSDGNLNMESVRAFSRVYPRAIAGIPLVLIYDPPTLSFQCQYIVNQTISEPTEIFVPMLHYPRGLNVTVSEGMTWTWDETSSSVLVRPVSGSATKDQTIGAVFIHPKKGGPK